MNELDQKIVEHFEGKVVRKDLTKSLKGNAVVPTYVLEYLLGQHCSTNDEEIIKDGIEKVKNIIAAHFVHRDEAESVKSNIREKGSFRIIDKISVRLNDRLDRYEAKFTNLGLNNIPVNSEIVTANPKLLSEGVWSLINVAYVPVEEKNTLPWIIESLKPIQISNIDLDEYVNERKSFTLNEWMDLLMQTIGLNPEEFSQRSKLIQLSRLIPFAENNYNLIELGPKGTGKSHIFSEMSPHGILLSGAEVSKAKLFVNNATGNIGLVGYWDVVAYDEFAGNTKRVENGLVDIMKNYMANKSFSRGTDVLQAEASMVFVGNTDRGVANMVKHSDLFISLPKGYYDTAFLDRMHLYLPGWEVSKLRNELFTNDFGFVVDYLAEILKLLRKKDFGKSYQKYFTLSDTISTRDRTGIEKTFSGLVKILFPDGDFTKEDAKLMLDFAVEGRMRVKLQLQKMDETFSDDVVKFEYKDAEGNIYQVNTLEEQEYGEILENNSVETSSQTIKQSPSEISEKNYEAASESLFGINKTIRENQTNISYDRLFGHYLEGATEFVIQDPYIRMPHQFKNLIELCSLIVRKNAEAEQLKIHLITWNEMEYQEVSITSLQEIQSSLEELNVEFTYEFKESAHDRSISLNNDWRIILGRGLDIWQKSSGKYDIAEVMQEKRKCREFELTVIKS
ncbi:BREX system Lon protease-like protein BrxL [Candidatus Kaistella beijingensis]|uniref:BREX system Lon protease-like protein BrxL n=1 Tax=Candidatus Kaistella beijingensis TaxID=2820270 RepID=UPI001CC6C8A8|nr:BREX system Lon protease-like protein BrxL [Candidatus Kaistella beijingensis]UBB90907.1 BREX system Lon protease-like protein BrxL [Candidatus Kaistella beijingensis]